MDRSARLPQVVLPLDAIRFLAALSICLYHGVKPPGSRIVPWFDFAWDRVLFGGTGVLAFFIISGFCIHYPALATGSVPKWGSFLTRRYVRVMIPFLAILPFAAWTGRDYNMLWGNDLAWTILCDLVYYSLYPILFHAARRVGWMPLLAGSFVFTAVGVAMDFYQIDWGTTSMVLIFLPVWIMGCVLADWYVKHATAGTLTVPPVSAINTLRAAVIVLTSVMGWMTFAGFLGWVYFGVLISPILMAWLWFEIRTFSDGRSVPPAALAWAGTWIYSLYLTHPITQTGIDMVMAAHFPGANTLLHSHFVWLSLRFVLMISATLGAAYVFAVLVEWPSHRLARSASRMVKF